MRLFLPILASCLIACGSAIKAGPQTGKRVVGLVEVHKRYCGGARPSPEQERGTFKPMPAATFFVVEGEINPASKSAVARFTTNEEGNFEVHLPVGTYSVMHIDKQLPYQTFRQKNAATGQHHQDKEEACFEAWYNSADFVLTVRQDTNVVLTYRSRCHTGTNPCIRYDGPIPP